MEVDRFLWQDGWVPTPTGVYDRLHDDVIQQDAWVVDGLGRQASIPRRLARATEVILVDMPLWMHFWLAAERQIAWANGTLEHAPGGIAQAPPTEALFRTIWGGGQGLDARDQDALHRRREDRHGGASYRKRRGSGSVRKDDRSTRMTRKATLPR